MEPKAGETFVDATVNRGGHAKEIALLLGAKGHLVGIDQDESALKEAEENLKDAPCQITLIHGNFRNISSLVKKEGIKEVDGVLMDIGLSSDQLGESGRGFSFQKDEPLLMTFKTSADEDTLTAKEIVNNWDVENIATILTAYGEEQFAGKIAEAIVIERKVAPIETTADLVRIIERVVPFWYKHKKIHFATKTFQALRIAVNDEMSALKEGLEGAFEILRPGGRLGVISFHSLEAKILKNFMKEKEGAGLGKLVTGKAILPSRAEIVANPRSRSAQLKIIKKI